MTPSVSPAHGQDQMMPGPGQHATARNNVHRELQHWAPKASLTQAHQSALQMCLLNVFNIAVADRVMQSSLSHTSSQVHGDRGYKPGFVSFPGNDQDTGLAAQITRTLQGQATVISLCALEAFSVSSPARGTWQESPSCWAVSALQRPILMVGAEQVQHWPQALENWPCPTDCLLCKKHCTPGWVFFPMGKHLPERSSYEK